ncbi:MAG: fatty acid kinase fatty acid binding subunit [Thermoleophilaceae bacterium]|jgi:DegV family protein with EDD domain|nr:fatty acid kinase fatty acid binding subunit [Thermoleophilaceae bacterium]
MPPVAVVTDTTGYIPVDVAEANAIHQVSLYVNFGGERTEKETDLKDLDAFYEELRTADALPTTSQPSVGDFIEAYEPLLADGRDIVSVHLSAGISGTVDAAQQAKEALERDGRGGERVHVFDSATAAGGQGMVTMAAARRALGGGTAEEVLTAARDARADLKMWFAVDTLEYFKRSGRIGAASAWIGSTLKIKPILTLEAEITPVERVRTNSRMFERMVDYARQRESSGACAWVVQHIQAEEQATALADECRKIFGREPLYFSEVGPVLGCHAGPGMLGVGSIPERYLV